MKSAIVAAILLVAGVGLVVWVQWYAPCVLFEGTDVKNVPFRCVR